MLQLGRDSLVINGDRLGSGYEQVKYFGLF
jgi:hypothetical protein